MPCIIWMGRFSHKSISALVITFLDHVNQMISAAKCSNVFGNVNNEINSLTNWQGKKISRHVPRKTLVVWIWIFCFLLLRDVTKWQFSDSVWPLFRGKMRGIILGGDNVAVVGRFSYISCHEWGVLFVFLCLLCENFSSWPSIWSWTVHRLTRRRLWEQTVGYGFWFGWVPAMNFSCNVSQTDRE